MSTQLSSGLFKHKCNSHSSRVPSLLKQRELGMKNTGKFTEGDRSYIGHQYLPHKFKQVASLNHKMFCGNFSKDGSVFLSASQGKNDYHLCRHHWLMNYLFCCRSFSSCL